MSTQSDHYAVLHILLLELFWILALKGPISGSFWAQKYIIIQVFSHFFQIFSIGFLSFLFYMLIGGTWCVFQRCAPKALFVGLELRLQQSLLGRQASCSIFWVCVCHQQLWNNRWMGIHEISGYGHKQQLARLFHAWLDCFALLKLGTLEVCTLRVLLVSSTPTSIYLRWRSSNWQKFRT